MLLKKFNESYGEEVEKTKFLLNDNDVSDQPKNLHKIVHEKLDLIREDCLEIW